VNARADKVIARQHHANDKKPRGSGIVTAGAGYKAKGERVLRSPSW
jgi:hypothetical protein